MMGAGDALFLSPVKTCERNKKENQNGCFVAATYRVDTKNVGEQMPETTTTLFPYSCQDKC